MPIHWSTFNLTGPSMGWFSRKITKEADRENINYITPKIGEIITYNTDLHTDKWRLHIK